jgi:hypothetical protein
MFAVRRHETHGKDTSVPCVHEGRTAKIHLCRAFMWGARQRLTTVSVRPRLPPCHGRRTCLGLFAVLWSDARHRLLFAVRLGSDARQRDLHRAFIGAVRRGVGARQRVAFAVRPMESARQILWRTAKAVFPVVRVQSSTFLVDTPTTIYRHIIHHITHPSGCMAYFVVLVLLRQF